MKITVLIDKPKVKEIITLKKNLQKNKSLIKNLRREISRLKQIIRIYNSILTEDQRKQYHAEITKRIRS